MGKVIGIDLGTTNSAMAVLQGSEPEIIINSEGGRTTPSVVSFLKDGERVVGRAALNQQVTNYQNTVYSVKRFIGRLYDELTEEDLKGLTYDISKGDKGRPVIHAGGMDMMPEQVSAAVLARLKADAEKFLGEEVSEAVITVPAYFNDNQRQATKDAGKIAGLEVHRIINEPTAAAMAFGFDKAKAGEDPKKVLVFDLGGGTFDVSILEITPPDLIEVISTAGDNHLGGDLWDSAFCSWLCDKFKAENGIDLAEDPMTHSRVLEAARQGKEDLSTSTSVQINLPFITQGPSGPLHMDYTVTREEFEAATADLLRRCEKPIDDAMHGYDTNPISLTNADIDEVLLVGGSTRMPAVQALVERKLGKKPNATVNPDEVVAMGACIQGGVLAGECDGIILADVNSMSVGVWTYPDSVNVMIPANTPIPASKKEIYTTASDNQTNVEIKIVQGENPVASSPDNKLLGTAVLEGIPPMRRGEPQIEITLKYDVNGIINVSATELSSMSHIEVTIEGSSKLSENEVNALAAAEKALGSKKE